MKKLEGITIPAVTPFDKNGEIDFEMMRLNFKSWCNTGIAGIMCLGSNGEFRALDDEESLSVISAASEFIAPDKCLIAGVGRESLYHTLRFIERVGKVTPRLDYVSVLTPCYFSNLMSDRAIVNYYTSIADCSPYPVLLYCAPPFANGVTISIEAVKILAEHPNIYGIKDTSANMMSGYMNAVGNRDDFVVVSGSVNSLIQCIDLGGCGGVISAANYFPVECVRLLNLYKEAGREKALEYYSVLRELIKNTGARESVAGVKCCMNLVGLHGGYPRLPILPVSEDSENEMRKALFEAGY